MGIIAAVKSAFDFDAAVVAPFRMQPGLRRIAAGAAQLSVAPPGSRHQREKLAVLSARWQAALCVEPAFDPTPALAALLRHAAAEHPQAWAWDGETAHALSLGVAVRRDGRVEQLRAGSFGLGDEVSRCLDGLPDAWRLAGLASLTFAEDFAIVDGTSGRIPWLAVALPSHWAPESKVGLDFRAVHAPVADNAQLLKAADALLQLVCAPPPPRWERFVWTVSDQPRLNAHPAQIDTDARWPQGRVEPAWWRSERQTFIAVPAMRQAVFTIRVDVQPLADAVATRAHAARLHDAIASMSPAVIDYRGLAPVRDALLAWLAARR